MKLKLTPDDRTAIDLLLGEASAAAQNPPQRQTQRYAATADTQHVQAVRTVLQLLAVLPAPEPSPDLVSRTLAHVQQAAGQTHQPIAQPAAPLSMHPPA